MSNGPSVDVEAFYNYLGQKLGDNGKLSTPEQLLEDWRASQDQDYEETVDDVRQGIVDFEAGKGKPVGDAFSDIRKKLGFTS